MARVIFSFSVAAIFLFATSGGSIAQCPLYWEEFVGREVTVEGVLQQEKIGVFIKTDNGSIWVRCRDEKRGKFDHISPFEESVLFQKIKAKGILRKAFDLPICPPPDSERWQEGPMQCMMVPEGMTFEEASCRLIIDDAQCEVEGPTSRDIIFPQIRSEGVHRSRSLGLIAEHWLSHGWQPIARDQIRLAVQPMGIVGASYEINLKTSEVMVLPGQHAGSESRMLHLSKRDINRIVSLITSKEFRDLPHTNDKFGFDGTTYFIEADIGGSYYWLLHWAPDDPIVRDVYRMVDEAVRNKRYLP